MLAALVLPLICVMPMDFAPFMMSRQNICIESPAPYLIRQGFECPTGGYDHGPEIWTESGTGTIDQQYTATVLAGTQSLSILQSANIAGDLSPTFTAQDEVWVYLLLRPVSIEAGIIRTLVGIRNSSGSTFCGLQIDTDGSLRVAMNVVADTVGTVSAGTTYHIWFHYKKGTGADAIADVGFSTNGIRPTSGNNFAQTTTGNPTSQAVAIMLGPNASATQQYIFDNVRVDDVQIGDNPP